MGNPSILSPSYFTGCCYCAVLAGFGWEVVRGDFVDFLQFLAFLVVYNLFFSQSGNIPLFFSLLQVLDDEISRHFFMMKYQGIYVAPGVPFCVTFWPTIFVC